MDILKYVEIAKGIFFSNNQTLGSKLSHTAEWIKTQIPQKNDKKKKEEISCNVNPVQSEMLLKDENNVDENYDEDDDDVLIPSTSTKVENNLKMPWRLSEQLATSSSSPSAQISLSQEQNEDPIAQYLSI